MTNISKSDLRICRRQRLQHKSHNLWGVWRGQARVHDGLHVGAGRQTRTAAVHADGAIPPMHYAHLHVDLHGAVEGQRQQVGVGRGHRLRLRLRRRLVHRPLHRAVPVQHRDLPDPHPQCLLRDQHVAALVFPVRRRARHAQHVRQPQHLRRVYLLGHGVCDRLCYFGSVGPRDKGDPYGDDGGIVCWEVVHGLESQRALGS